MDTSNPAPLPEPSRFWKRFLGEDKRPLADLKRYIRALFRRSGRPRFAGETLTVLDSSLLAGAKSYGQSSDVTKLRLQQTKVFFGWIYAIAANKLHDLRRFERARVRGGAEHFCELDTSNHAARPGVSTEATIELSEGVSVTLADVTRELEHLKRHGEPARHTLMAFELHILDGLPIAVVSDRLGVSPTTVKDRVKRSRGLLIARLRTNQSSS